MWNKTIDNRENVKDIYKRVLGLLWLYVYTNLKISCVQI